MNNNIFLGGDLLAKDGTIHQCCAGIFNNSKAETLTVTESLSVTGNTTFRQPITIGDGTISFNTTLDCLEITPSICSPTLEGDVTIERLSVDTNIYLAGALFNLLGEPSSCCAVQTLQQNGDILYHRSGSDTRLSIGNTSQVLAVVSGFPEWVKLSHYNLSDIGNLTHSQLDAAIALLFSLIDQNLTTASSPTFTNLTVGGIFGVGGDPNPCCTGAQFNLLVSRGDLLSFDEQNVRIPIGLQGQVLTVDDGQPTWLNITQAQSLNETSSPTFGNLTLAGYLLQHGGPHPCCTGAEFNLLNHNGDLLYFNETNWRLPIGTSDQVLTVIGGFPVWYNFTSLFNLFEQSLTNTSNPAFFNLTLGGNLLQNDQIHPCCTGTNFELLTTIGDLLYFDGTNLRLPIGTPSQILTVVDGLPTWKTLNITELVNVDEQPLTNVSSPTFNNLTLSGYVLQSGNFHPCCTGAQFDLLTTKGDLLTYNTSNQRLPIGTSNQVLMSIQNLPTWNQLNHSALSFVGNLTHPEIDLILSDLEKFVNQNVSTYSDPQFTNITLAGLLYTPAGTIHPCCLGGVSSQNTTILTTNGDILYYFFGDQRLPIGGSGQVLIVDMGLPSWQTMNSANVPIFVEDVNINVLINQNVQSTASPTFVNLYLTGVTTDFTIPYLLTIDQTSGTLYQRNDVVFLSVSQTLTQKEIDSSFNDILIQSIDINSLIDQSVQNSASPTFVNLFLTDIPTDYTRTFFLTVDQTTGEFYQRNDVVTLGVTQTLVNKSIDTYNNTITVNGTNINVLLAQNLEATSSPTFEQLFLTEVTTDYTRTFFLTRDQITG